MATRRFVIIIVVVITCGLLSFVRLRDPIANRKYAIFCGVFENGEFNTDIRCRWRGSEYVPPIAVERTSSWFDAVTLIMNDDEISLDEYEDKGRLIPKTGGVYGRKIDIMVLYFSTENIIDFDKANEIIEEELIPAFITSVRRGYNKDENGVLQLRDLEWGT